MSFSPASRLQRIGRIDGVTRGDQRQHPRTPIGFDADQYLLRLVIIANVTTVTGTGYLVQRTHARGERPILD